MSMEYLSNRDAYRDLLPLDGDFISANVRFTWPEINWGFDAGLIGWYALKQFAEAALRNFPEADDENLSALARLTKQEAGTAGEFVRSLAGMGPQLDETVARKKWAYLLLKKLYEDRSQVPDPFGIVEHIYADFDYPEELEGFVRWMPATEQVSSPEEGASRMDQKWRTYLANSAAQFSS